MRGWYPAVAGWGYNEMLARGKYRAVNRLYYYGARYYDPRSSIWLSTDPLQEKYPSVSTYAYCTLNPVKYIDPNGKEKLIGFNIDHSNPTVRAGEIVATEGARLENDNNMIHIYAHGSTEGFSFYDSELKQTIKVTSIPDFEEFLNERSELWKNRKEGELMYVVLHACLTGREAIQDNFVMPSAAEWFSSLANTVVIAPDQKMVLGNRSGEFAIWKQLGVDRNGGWLSSRKEFSLVEYGNWNVFSETSKIASFLGTVENKPQNVSNYDIDISKMKHANGKLPNWLQSPLISNIKDKVIPNN